MKYTIKAHPTMYAGVQFRSRLEARWAAFFDLIQWEWEYEPIDLPGWSPDFRVEFPCGKPSCVPTHSLLVEVKPYRNIEDFAGHPCMDYDWGTWCPPGVKYLDDPRCLRIQEAAGAAFGITPYVTEFCIVHGDGGGSYSLPSFGPFCVNIDAAWKEAGNATQWLP